MTSGDLAKLLSELLNVPFSTIDLYGRYLRNAGLLSMKGHGRGAASMKPRDAAYWLTALCVDHERGGDFVREVKRVWALPLLDAQAFPSVEITKGLLFPTARNAGEAIEFAISDTQSPIFVEMLHKRVDCLTVGYDSEGQSAYVSISPGKVDGSYRSGVWTFQRGEKKRRLIERTTSIHGAVLYEIAKALGPEALIHPKAERRAVVQ
jgi:hypothetical protein